MTNLFKTEAYIVKIMNVWGETYPKWRFICEANSSKYTRLLTDEELKNETLWKPRVYNSFKAAQAAIRYINGGDELHTEIIPIYLNYQIRKTKKDLE